MIPVKTKPKITVTLIHFSELGIYNSLSDPLLAEYFKRPNVRSHLIQNGLVREFKIFLELFVIRCNIRISADFLPI